MLQADPAAISFHNVLPRQEYSTNFRLDNSLAAPAHLILTPSSSQLFQISPTEIHLAAKQSIIITVKLYLDHVPNMKMLRDDFIMVKLKDQNTPMLKVPIEFSLSSRSASSSPTPSSRRISATVKHKGEKSSSSSILNELHAQNVLKEKRIKELEESLGGISRKHPELDEVVQSVRDEERSKYEERSRRVLALFREKDEEIERLKLLADQQEQSLRAYREGSQSAPRPAAPPIQRLIDENSRLNEQLVARGKELRELQAAKEKAADQAAQLEALVAELHGCREKLRGCQDELRRKNEQLAAALRESKDLAQQ